MNLTDVVSTIRTQFDTNTTLTVRQIRSLSPALDNANLVRKGFKTLIDQGICKMEGSKRGSHYVRMVEPAAD